MNNTWSISASNNVKAKTWRYSHPITSAHYSYPSYVLDNGYKRQVFGLSRIKPFSCQGLKKKIKF